ncbi:MAG: redoxin domain-containing protein [Verrucomicrobia bacterium]|jgi:protein SCO1|nr:redoxin domain-containing protein [Verrucomicrobiota bacterium]
MISDRLCLGLVTALLSSQVVFWVGCGVTEEGGPVVTTLEPAEDSSSPNDVVVISTTDNAPNDQPDVNKEGQLKLFTVSGVVKSIEPDLSRARIEHEEIPNYMKHMTMPFNIGDTNEWSVIQPDDEITFLLHVTDDRSWIDGVEKKESDVPSLDELPKTAPWRQVREVEALEVGDLLPNYPLTNQFSKPISFDQYRGKALAISFIYTRCPLPDFCPKMNQQFLGAQEKLKGMEEAPDNWQLLSISFDPVNDTPERLKFYASAYQYDPEKWNFVTGAMVEIDALTEQFGLMFYRTEGSLMDWDHNLRTILVDPDGKIQEIIIGNLWKTEELVEKIVKLANGESIRSADGKKYE